MTIKDGFVFYMGVILAKTVIHIAIDISHIVNGKMGVSDVIKKYTPYKDKPEEKDGVQNKIGFSID